MGKDKSSKKDRKDKKRKRDKEDEEEYRKSKAEKLVSLQVSKAVAVPLSFLRWPLISLHAVNYTALAPFLQTGVERHNSFCTLSSCTFSPARSCRPRGLPVTLKSTVGVMATQIRTTPLGTAMSQSASCGARNSRSKSSQEWM